MNPENKITTVYGEEIYGDEISLYSDHLIHTLYSCILHMSFDENSYKKTPFEEGIKR